MLAGAGLTAMTLLGLGGTASATETASPSAAPACYGVSDPPGSGCFRPYGDDIVVHDKVEDGIGVQVYWKTNYGRSGTCRDKDSGGGAKYCYYDMSEGRQVRLWLQFTDDGRIIREITSRWFTI